VLIEMIVHHGVMFAFIVIAFVLVVGMLAVVAGADSRIDDIARRRRYLG
jgi:hypothetical protein